MGGFFPGKKYGGPPVSVDSFCSLMKTDECYIITHNHDKGEKSPYINILSGKWISRENCNVMYLPDNEYTKNTFEKVDTWLNENIFEPLKDKFTKENIKNATKKFIAKTIMSQALLSRGRCNDYLLMRVHNKRLVVEVRRILIINNIGL